MTLDLDFGKIREYPPEEYRGLTVLRVVDQSRGHMLRVMERVIAVQDCAPLEGHLWVVSEGGIPVPRRLLDAGQCEGCGGGWDHAAETRPERLGRSGES